jgi:hypothetical protein
MRVPLAILILGISVSFAQNSPADAAGKHRHAAKRPYSHSHPRKVDIACEESARREDPTGVYASYPCWARAAFARSINNLPSN